MRGSDTSEVVFEGCPVPAENLLGKEGQGFIVAMKTFDMSRPGVASQALGIAAGIMPGVQAMRLRIVDAPEVVAMDDPPTAPARTKRNSSMAVAARLVRDGEACAFVTRTAWSK